MRSLSPGEEEGESEMHGERNMQIYKSVCKKDSQWEFPISIWMNLIAEMMKNEDQVRRRLYFIFIKFKNS